MKKYFILLVIAFLFSNSLFAGLLNYTKSEVWNNDLEIGDIYASDRAQFVANEIVGGAIDFNSLIDGDDFDSSSLSKTDILNNLGSLGTVVLKNKKGTIMNLKFKIEISTNKEGKLAEFESDTYKLSIPAGETKVFNSTELNTAGSDWFKDSDSFSRPDESVYEGFGNDALQAGLAYGEPIPERIYTIKVSFYDADVSGFGSTNLYGSVEATIVQRLTTGQTVLNWPMDNSKLSLTEAQSLTFVWSPLTVRTAVSVKYIFRLYEMPQGGSPKSAVQGFPIVETDLIDICALDYPSYAPALQIGNKYVWYIEARDLTGRLIGSGYSLRYTFEVAVPDPPKLENPIGNVLTPLIMFSWSEVEGAESYALKIGTNVNMSDIIYEKTHEDHLPKSIEDADTLFEPYKTYYWTVQAYDKSGEEFGEKSAVGRFLLERGIELIRPVDTQVMILPPDFSWTSLPGATSYVLLVADNSSFANAEEYITDKASFQPNDDDFYVFDKTYFWKVQAYNASGEKWGNESKSTSFKSPERSVPETYSPAEALNMMDNIQFSWQKVNWATRYELYIADNNNFNDARVIEVVDPPYVLANDGFIKMEKTYYWKVTPYDEVGESYSKTSKITQFKGRDANIPSLYSPLNETIFSLENVQFNFEKVDWATKYELFIADNRAFSNAIKIEIDGAPYVFNNDGSLIYSKEYFWKVVPYDQYEENYNKSTAIGSFKTPVLPIVELLSPLNSQLDPYADNIYNWKLVDWADSYVLSIADNNNMNNSIIYNGNPPITLEAGKLQYGKSYFWKVTAIDNSGVYKDSDSSLGSFTANPAPVLQLLEPVKSDFQRDETVKFVWSQIKGASYYVLEIAETDKFSNSASIRTEKLEETYSEQLKAGQKYFYRVKAYDSNDKEIGKGSDIKAFVVVNEEATVTYPDILYPINEISEMFPILEWVRVEKATEYEVIIKNMKDNKTVTVKSKENKIGLKDVAEILPGATYEWRVDALFEEGKPVSSREKKTFTLPKDKIKITAPLQKEIEGTEVTLKWNTLKYIEKYKVDFSADNGRKDTFTVNEDSLKLSELKPGNYKVKVVGLKDDKEFTNWSDVTEFKVLQPVIKDKLSLVSPINETVEGSIVNLSWSKGPAETDKYKVSYSDDPAMSKAKSLETKEISVTLQDIKNGTYYWQVQALDKSNKILTQPSNIASFRFVFKDLAPTQDTKVTEDIKEETPTEEAKTYIEATASDLEEFAEFIKEFLKKNGAGNVLNTMKFDGMDVNGKKSNLNKVLLDQIISGELEIKYIQLR